MELAVDIRYIIFERDFVYQIQQKLIKTKCSK